MENEVTCRNGECEKCPSLQTSATDGCGVCGQDWHCTDYHLRGVVEAREAQPNMWETA